ncbi:MAG: permease [Firmicutes bacterium]|nr:permease [Bacillota bacterium]
MKELLKRYRFFLVMVGALLALALWDRPHEAKAMQVLGFSFKEMVLVIPPIFVLLGFLDVWVSKETMVRYMGQGSGLKGILLAIFIGSAAAGPLYGAFPVAAVFMKKGVSMTNILIFIGAWSTTKIPMFLFELSALGVKFALTRLLIDIPGIIIIAYLINKAVSPKERDALYKAAEKL